MGVTTASFATTTADPLAPPPPDSSGALSPNGSDAQAYADAIGSGRQLYLENCAVCHGKAAGGLEDARLSFPPLERHCTRCHKPNNRRVQPLSSPVIDNDMFDVGTPPALAGATASGGLSATLPPMALWAYIANTMPRYEPGRQTPEEYWLMTAYLLDLNGRQEAAAAAIAAADGH